MSDHKPLLSRVLILNELYKQRLEEIKTIDRRSFTINPSNEIGSGAYGTVYRSTYANQDKLEEIAIKAVPYNHIELAPNRNNNQSSVMQSCR